MHRRLRGPDFSPDGTRMAFESGRGYSPPSEEKPVEASIWTIGVDGTGEQQLTRGPSDRFPRWSPDGTRIAFQRQSGDTIHPTILDVDTGTLTVLDAPVSYDLDWVTDDVLGGVGYDERDYSIYLLRIDVATGRSHRLETGVNDVGGQVLWSPDGSEFAYVRSVDYKQPYDPEARPAIQIRDLETGQERTVPGSDTLVNRPVLWTSDDSLLFLQNTRGAGYDIALSADGGRAAERVVTGHRDGRPVGDPVSDNPTCPP